MTELEEITEEIRRLKSAECTREWRKNNKEKKKKYDQEWNAKFGKEYQRAYYLKRKNK